MPSWVPHQRDNGVCVTFVRVVWFGIQNFSHASRHLFHGWTEATLSKKSRWSCKTGMPSRAGWPHWIIVNHPVKARGFISPFSSYSWLNWRMILFTFMCVMTYRITECHVAHFKLIMHAMNRLKISRVITNSMPAKLWSNSFLWSSVKRRKDFWELKVSNAASALS